MQRRWLVAGVAGAALLAGAGWAVWRRYTLDAGSAGLWDMRFARPEGGELVMAALRGRPLVVNFWASWCAPCVKEMPEFDRFYREFSARGWQVVGLAIDSPAQVRDFLKGTPVSFPIGMAGFEGSDLMRGLGNSAGVLPFTVVFDRDGAPVQQRRGETSYRELVEWVRRM